MHMQIRLHPKASAPNVAKLLAFLAEKQVNLTGVGGSDVEFGGEFAFSVKDEEAEDVLKLLHDNHYRDARLLNADDPTCGLTLCEVENRAGALSECLASASTDNLGNGRIIRDLLIQVPSDNGKVPVQIYSEEVLTGRA